MSTNQFVIFHAYCIDCGVEISQEAHSHIFCSEHHSPEKMQNLRQRQAQFCNVCGQRMMPGTPHLAHGACLLEWIRHAQEIQ